MVHLSRPRVRRFAFVVVFLVAFGAFQLFVFHRGVHDNEVLAERGQPALARVTDISDDKYRKVTVEFTTADGRVVTSVLRREEVADVGERQVRAGDEFEVRYDPEHPRSRVADSRLGGASRGFNVWLPAASAAACFIVAAILCLMCVRRKKALEDLYY